MKKVRILERRVPEGTIKQIVYQSNDLSKTSLKAIEKHY